MNEKLKSYKQLEEVFNKDYGITNPHSKAISLMEDMKKGP